MQAGELTARADVLEAIELTAAELQDRLAQGSERLFDAYAAVDEPPDPERLLVYQLLAGHFELVRLAGRLADAELRTQERVTRALAFL